MLLRYDSVKVLLRTLVAAAVMACPTTGSAMPVTWEVWTSKVARRAVSPLWSE